jgi:hypothetical protein
VKLFFDFSSPSSFISETKLFFTPFGKSFTRRTKKITIVPLAFLFFLYFFLIFFTWYFFLTHTPTSPAACHASHGRVSQPPAPDNGAS